MLEAHHSAQHSGGDTVGPDFAAVREDCPVHLSVYDGFLARVRAICVRAEPKECVPHWQEFVDGVVDMIRKVEPAVDGEAEDFHLVNDDNLCVRNTRSLVPSKILVPLNVST